MCRGFMGPTLLDADEPYFLAALILAHRAFCAAAIFLRAAADTLRFGFSTAAVFLTDTPWPVSAPNNAKTCCNLPISALTSLIIFSTLNVFPIVARCDRTG
jgi:hypothetical protein